MKRQLTLLFLFAAIILGILPGRVHAASNSKDFTINSQGIIIGYTGKSSVVTLPSNAKALGSPLAGNDKITKVIIPKNIQQINDFAFMGCENLEEVVMEDGVSRIGYFAFQDCSQLDSITFSKNINFIDPLSGLNTTPWFQNNESDVIEIGSILYRYQGKDVRYTIPSNLTILQKDAFYDCQTLEEVTIPSTVTTIGDSVFNNCTNLQTISLPDHLTEITQAMFLDCKNLKQITIPSSVTVLGSRAFEGCENLETVSLPSGLKEIRMNAFATNRNGTSKLTNMTIPKTVTHAAAYFVTDSPWLSSSLTEEGYLIVGDGVFCGIYGRDDTETESLTLTLPTGVKTLASQVFEYEKYTEIILPDTLKRIQSEAFANSGLEKITIPDSVTKVEAGIFSNCTKLTKATLSRNCKTLSDRMFYSCTSIKEITIPKGVKEIGNRVFQDCMKLGKISIPSSITEVGSYAFDYTKWMQKQTGDFIMIGGFLLNYNGSKSSVTLPASVKTIGIGALANNRFLQTVTIPKGAEKISEDAFRECYNLTKVTIPSTVKTIGTGAFGECRKLKQITIPSSVTQIGDYVFLKDMGNTNSGNYAVTITCKKNSYAYRYARTNKLKVVVK